MGGSSELTGPRDDGPDDERHAFLDLAGLDQAARAAEGAVSGGYAQTVNIDGGEDGSVFHASALFSTYITSETLLASLTRMEFSKVTVVQAAAIPQIQAERDVVVQSHTGSGKTLAYLLPLLQRIEDDDGDENPEFQPVRVVIAAPTRELAMQISRECQSLLQQQTGPSDSGLDSTGVLPLIGGANTARQIEKLKKVKPSVVVGTPGRLLELARGARPALRLRKLHALVVDEVDHALAPAFRNELEALVAVCPKDKQTVLVSATASRPLVRDFAVQTMRDPVLLQVDAKRSLPESISHYYTLVPRQKKLDAIRRIMYTDPVPRVAICFVDDQRRAYIVAEKMAEFGIRVVALSGDADKVERANVLQATRRGEVSLLVTTEVAARGIDLPSLTHVINLNLPTDADHYIHRAGRCGRVGAPGTVISIVRPEMQFVIEKITKPLGIDPVSIALKGGRLTSPRSLATKNNREKRFSSGDRKPSSRNKSSTAVTSEEVKQSNEARLSERRPKSRTAGGASTKSSTENEIPTSPRAGSGRRESGAGPIGRRDPSLQREDWTAREPRVSKSRRPRSLKRRAAQEGWVGNRSSSEET